MYGKGLTKNVSKTYMQKWIVELYTCIKMTRPSRKHISR